MADCIAFFDEYLPSKIKEDPSLAEDVNAVFQFDIEGAGIWTLDLTGEGTIIKGAGDNVGCVITCTKDNWEKILDNPKSAMQMFMLGKLKASNIGLATKLQKILG
jgi:putative sterol carrier protein